MDFALLLEVVEMAREVSSFPARQAADHLAGRNRQAESTRVP
jgi:hypothetical protein